MLGTIHIFLNLRYLGHVKDKLYLENNILSSTNLSKIRPKPFKVGQFRLRQPYIYTGLFNDNKYVMN